MFFLRQVPLVLLSTFLVCAKQKTDTYLAAYVDSHGPNSLPPGVVYGAPAPVPSVEYGKPGCKQETPAKDYGTPTSQYGTPSSQYGTPSSQYGTPSSQYGTPSSQYGTPSSQYGTPSTQYGYSYGEPHAAPETHSALAPLGDKLGLIFKILLKVLIFKLIVKFIAVICVLLFLPKLSLAKEELRMFKDDSDVKDNHLELTQLVMDSISGAPVTCRDEDGFGCRLRKAVTKMDSKYSVSSLRASFHTTAKREECKHRLDKGQRVGIDNETIEMSNHKYKLVRMYLEENSSNEKLSLKQPINSARSKEQSEVQNSQTKVL